MNHDDFDDRYSSANAGSASRNPATLETLGWGPFFAQQIRIIPK